MSGTRRLGLLRGIPEGVPWDVCYWDFTGNLTPTDYLELSPASDFQPGSADFTALAVFKPKTVLSGGHMISVCADAGSNEVSWRLYYQSNGTLRAIIRKGTGVGESTNVYVSSAAALNQLFMAIVRYHYNGDGSSGLYVHAISDSYATKTASNGSAVSIADFGGGLGIGNMDPWDTSQAVTGEFYAAAYWDSLIDLSDLENLWDGSKTMEALAPRMCVNFCKDVASTYEAEIGDGPNAPYIFDVHGNPTKGT